MLKEADIQKLNNISPATRDIKLGEVIAKLIEDVEALKEKAATTKVTTKAVSKG